MTGSKLRRAFRMRRFSKSNSVAWSAAALVAGALIAGSITTPASAQSLGYAIEPSGQQPWPNAAIGIPAPQDQTVDVPSRDIDVLPPTLRRQIVDYTTSEPAGTIIVDTPHTVLYFVLGNHRAIRYGVGVGREGFTWAGTETVTRKAEWPDWIPPSEMIARQPYLPRFVAGGPGNPLGARAMYLGGSKYRIHGTNDPTTIGKFVSSGCIRLTNTDVEDLFSRVSVGAKVVVLPKTGGRARAELAPAHPAPRTVAANLGGSALY